MSTFKIVASLGAGTLGLLGVAWTLHADPPAKPGAAPRVEPRVTIATAKDRAKLLHEVYSATLDSMHHHFFRRDRAVLPARAMDDIFEEVDKTTKIQTRWIAVNTPAMSLNHEPESAFEKKAAAELSAGKTEWETVEKGYYRRATPIPLGAGCVGCHTKFGATNDKTARFAGLVVSIPLIAESK